MNSDKVLDAKGLACPMPIVKTKKAIDEIDSGQVLEIHATDKGAKSDLSSWVKSGGHELLQDTEEDGVFKFWVKKA
ncbi:sulfurtransferase TusA family protein [Bacillus sp. Marseille-Q3570]|uniref:sulfurtransferase TusA family protein n=1 Tax=Bacillus sp. Marseille-Q3570 TaxID=2963522 RepID=UPI0021B6EF6B|nr:sulfurtransferase TusA family protein [Bacillus sp. Marseille-Q3570]